MRHILPHPILTVFLIIFWLILQQSVTPGQFILGTLIGILTGLLTHRLGLEKPSLRHPLRLPALMATVALDSARSTDAVAWRALTQKPDMLRSGFIHVPLKTRDRTVLAFLSMILTATPGTVWVEFDEERGELLLHVLDLVDEAHWVDIISNRYEKRLMEIFQ